MVSFSFLQSNLVFYLTQKMLPEVTEYVEMPHNMMTLFKITMASLDFRLPPGYKHITHVQEKKYIQG